LHRTPGSGEKERANAGFKIAPIRNSARLVTTTILIFISMLPMALPLIDSSRSRRHWVDGRAHPVPVRVNSR
jgi:hypothetical protein